MIAQALLHEVLIPMLVAGGVMLLVIVASVFVAFLPTIRRRKP